MVFLLCLVDSFIIYLIKNGNRCCTENRRRYSEAARSSVRCAVASK